MPQDVAFFSSMLSVGTFRVELRDVKASFRLAYPEFADAGDFSSRLLAALRRLETGNRIVMPVAKVGWDGGVHPALPRWLTLARVQAPQVVRAAIAWVPELYFASAGNVDTRQTLVQINDWLRVLANRSRPMVPTAERSLEIFGDEKRLQALCKGTNLHGDPLLFGGKLRLSDLRAHQIEPPLHYVIGNGGRPVLVVENLASYDTFCRWNTTAMDSFGAVAWGAGGCIDKSWTHLRALTRSVGTTTVFYLGDLDAPGLNILGRIAKKADQDNQFRLVPHEPFYRYLVIRGRRVTRKTEQAVLATAINVLKERFPLDIYLDIQNLLIAGQAIPQEGLGIEALTDGSAWMDEIG